MRGISEQQALKLIGARTLDVYLNNLAYWKNIPLRVWGYTIGDYQTIKKWLSYREREILGRALKMDEPRAVDGYRAACHRHPAHAAQAGRELRHREKRDLSLAGSSDAR